MNNLIMTFLSILIAAIIYIPIIHYLLTERKNRYLKLKAYLKPDIIKDYYTIFFPSIDIVKDSDLINNFERRYINIYGWRRYAIPLILYLLFLLVCSYLFYHQFDTWFNNNEEAIKLNPIVIFAFIGGYMAVAFDTLQNIKKRDLTSYDIYLSILRLLVSTGGGYAFSKIVTIDLAPAMAFSFGAFPIKSIIKYSRRFFSKKLGIGEASEIETSNLEIIDGIDRVEAERFRTINKTNILDFAYSDPIDVALRSNFDLIYVIDCIGQAIFLLYFKTDLDVLTKFGIRSSFELISLDNKRSSEIDNERNKYAVIISEISGLLGISEIALKERIFHVACDPHAIFLDRIWTPGFSAGKKKECLMQEET